MTFWLIISALALAVAVPLAWALLRRGAETRRVADFDIAVYRDQLQEVDRDLERGVITEDVAERTRIEISRRILDADKAQSATASGQSSRMLSLAITGAIVVFLVGSSLGLYTYLGAPGYGDLPLADRIEMAETMRANRPSQADAEAQAAGQLPPPPQADPQVLELVERLRSVMEDRGDDPRGWQLLAQNEAALGNFAEAHAAQSRLLELVGERAPGVAYADLAEFYILAAGGYVSPEAEAALTTALERDAALPQARYYTGLMYLQTGRPDFAFNIWRHLLENTPPDAPWNGPIRLQIEEVAWRAGVDYTIPPNAMPGATGPLVMPPSALPGPSAEDVQAAQDMAPEDRMAMIQGMVDGLAARLANEGGTGAEWARLISALGVLGDTDRAQAIFDEAQNVFAADPSAMEAVMAAAAQAGLQF